MTQTPDFWARTHRGLARDKNEDAFLWLGDAGTNEQGYLWLVCDGMGGEAAGELASSTVAQQIAEVYPRAMQSLSSPHLALTEAFQAANRRLLYMQDANADLAKMGSTVAAVAFYEGLLWFAAVGDSRIYTWSHGRLTQRSVDHTKYEKMMELGVLKPADARADHPAHHVLLNVLGRAGMEVDTLSSTRVSPKDTCVLICSDGLYSFVDERQLNAAFLHLNARDATRLLLSAALPHSNDNITVEVVRFCAPEVPRSITEVAAQLGITLIEDDGKPLQSSSLHFKPGARWQDHHTGGRDAVPASMVAPKKTSTTQPAQIQTALFHPDEAAALTPVPTASGARAKQTILFSGDRDGGVVDLSQDSPRVPGAPLADEEVPALDARGSEKPAAAPDATASKVRPRRRRTPGLFMSKADRATANEEEGDSQGLDPRILGLLAVVLVTFVAFGVFMWRGGTSPSSDGTPSPGASAPLAGEMAGAGVVPPSEQRELGDYQFPQSPRMPDRVHPIDEMPGFLVADGQLWMDAHEVTVRQFTKVAAESYALQGLVEQVDRERFSGLPCATGLTKDAARADEPVCASPQSAAVYCQAVGRTLPHEADWRSVLASDAPLIAAGYGRTFETAADGVPPTVVTPASGLLGVHDGLVEILEPNATQRRYKDEVHWIGGDNAEVRVVREGAMGPTDSSLGMVGFRCLERVVFEAPPVNEALVEEEGRTRSSSASRRSADSPSSDRAAAGNAAGDSTARDSAPNDLAANGSGASEGAANDSIAAEGVPTPDSGRLAPRVDPPNEAPIDPNVSDESLILQRLRQHSGAAPE